MAQYGEGPSVEEEEEEACLEGGVSAAEEEEHGAPCAEPALCHRVQALEEELRSCQEELCQIQRQLSLSQKLHQTAESTNQELRRQVRPHTGYLPTVHSLQSPPPRSLQSKVPNSHAYRGQFTYQHVYGVREETCTGRTCKYCPFGTPWGPLQKPICVSLLPFYKR